MSNPITLDWHEVTQLSLDLADKIIEGMRKTGERFDYLIAVPRGGYHPANIVARRLGLSPTQLLQFCIKTYSDETDRKTGKVETGQTPLPEQIQGKNLLIVDDVSDSGETLDYITTWLKRHGAKNVRTATLHFKPSQNTTSQAPDFYIAKIDGWVNYPWEAITSLKT